MLSQRWHFAANTELRQFNSEHIKFQLITAIKIKKHSLISAMPAAWQNLWALGEICFVFLGQHIIFKILWIWRSIHEVQRSNLPYRTIGEDMKTPLDQVFSTHWVAAHFWVAKLFWVGCGLFPKKVGFQSIHFYREIVRHLFCMTQLNSIISIIYSLDMLESGLDFFFFFISLEWIWVAALSW